MVVRRECKKGGGAREDEQGAVRIVEKQRRGFRRSHQKGALVSSTSSAGISEDAAPARFFGPPLGRGGPAMAGEVPVGFGHVFSDFRPLH